MKIGFVAPAQPDKGALVVGVLEERKLTPAAAAADAASGGQLSRAIEASRFKGKKKETLVVMAPSGVKASRIVLLGLGKADEIDATAAQDLGGEIVGTLQMSGETVATLLLEPPAGAKLGWTDAAANMAFGARLRAYRFDKYKTREKDDQKPSLAELRIGVADQPAAAAALAPLDRIADGIVLTRDVVSEPPNVIYPESFAAQCQALTGLGVAVEVLGIAEMKKLGMGSLLGVGQGSTREPRLVVMQWKGAGEAQPVAFVGKGVCFDTGGISIKPAAGMEDMKWDMAGAGAVLGAMKALAGRKAKANVIGVVALVENMPDGNAQRPSDIVTSMSGQTIEVLNTDAEGRLILADALWYTQDRFKPRFMVDFATLTGAIVVALGSEYAGYYANNEELAARLEAAGKAVGEPCWRMPLGEAYDKEIDSDAADVKNIGAGRGGGSIIGAVFLQRFVNKLDWAHVDIAGTAWSKKDKPTVPKGATAFGVRLIERLVAEHYEQK